MGIDSPSWRRERICSILLTEASRGKRRVRFTLPVQKAAFLLLYKILTYCTDSR